MCGRYALGIRAAFVRHQFQQHDMPIDEGQDEEEARESFNFAPGYHGLVYRADVPDSGARGAREEADAGIAQDITNDQDDAVTKTHSIVNKDKDDLCRPKYKLQSMKWGLIPFWTKRNPEYGSMLKTINCRDDSLLENRGMWTTMKKSKRCVVIAQGFYEWLKKNGGKEKIPHYMKRKDGLLMCFAGLWDCVRYEGEEQKHYTYTIITTDSNEQLKFLHDRMPVILEMGSEEMFQWLDPGRTEWNKELQGLLKPFEGELECYPVMKEVGKVGNNSPDFIVPVASSNNKQNIANFFANAKSPSKTKQTSLVKTETKDIKSENEAKDESIKNESQEIKIEKQEDQRQTVDLPRSEDNAPMPVTQETAGSKRSHDELDNKQEPSAKSTSVIREESPVKKKLRSSTSNGSAAKASPQKGGNQRITSFFGK